MDLIEKLEAASTENYKQNKLVLSFEEFLQHVENNPRRFIRNSAEYLLDMIKYFGEREVCYNDIDKLTRCKIFDLGTDRADKVIGNEDTQQRIQLVLESLIKDGYSSKLIILHGPNGAAKTTTIDTLIKGMEKYCQTDEGIVYKFNWIFPNDKDLGVMNNSSSIGFDTVEGQGNKSGSYAYLPDSKIGSKISSEYKENPVFLIPMPIRERWLKNRIAAVEGVKEDTIRLSKTILANGLCKKNKEIFEALLKAYKGRMSEVYRHIQVERFAFSKQYRTGLSIIEPQMSVDAQEKQITLDKNYANLPSILQTINFYEASGELIEANRGIIEFSDLLKRPIEAYKYLLGTIENSTVNLSSSTAQLDMVYFATTNDNYLDEFKKSPVFSSFKGRSELVQTPYLLLPKLEREIYEDEFNEIKKHKTVMEESLDLLCTWAVMTRLLQPNPENYHSNDRYLIKKIDPYIKLKIYLGEDLRGVTAFDNEDLSKIKQIRKDLMNEYKGQYIYEGRFGVSPREIKMLLYRSSKHKKHETLTPLAIFDEIDSLIKDRSIYEFLQIKPSDKYHDVAFFLSKIKEHFLSDFYIKLIKSMDLFEEVEYQNLLEKYLTHVVASVKKEKIFYELTGQYYDPSEDIMNDVETILEVSTYRKKEYRQNLLTRIGAYKLDNPDGDIKDFNVIFADLFKKIKNHFYEKKKEVIIETAKTMVSLEKGEKELLQEKDIALAQLAYDNLKNDWNIDRVSAFKCVQFCVHNHKEFKR